MSNPSTKDRDFGHSMGEKAKDTAHSMADKAKDTGTALVDKAKDLASQAGDKVKQAASAVGDAVGGAATNAGKTAEKWTSSAGSGIKNLGETIEHKGPQDGMLGNATRAVASTLEDTGRYIEQEGLSGMMDDVTDVVRRHPLPAVLVGIGLGFLLGRTLGS
jgi:ElaB/YqjD/DUF883 family membrane-anchored ribosome-binding protein